MNGNYSRYIGIIGRSFIAGAVLASYNNATEGRYLLTPGSIADPRFEELSRGGGYGLGAYLLYSGLTNGNIEGAKLAVAQLSGIAGYRLASSLGIGAPSGSDSNSGM